MAALEALGQAALDLFEQYGWAALVGMSVLEGLMLLYFAPSEALVPAGILLLAESPVGALAVVALVVTGATVGQFLLFSAAKRGGRRYLERSRWLSDGDRLDRVQGWFDRYGVVLVAVSNTLPLVRGMVTVPAGLADMDDRLFLTLSVVGTLCYQLLLAGVVLLVPELLPF